MVVREFAGVAETHVSTVFFAGDRAYKLLKPIATAFLDHSVTADRLSAARREIELNRRMAPDVYLGEAEVFERGELVDRMIVMRRLPADRCLASLVDDPDFDDHVRAAVRVVASFHADLTPVGDVDGPASLGVVRDLWNASLDEMASDMARIDLTAQHDEIRRLAGRYLDGRSELFAARIANGCQRDGHGDLQAQDIFCMDDGPRILDCLAFRDDLRISDVLNDIAFLAMDLERLAGPEMGAKSIGWYSEFTNEHHPASLAHHFIAYRALVRSKVSAIKAGQGDETMWLRAAELHAMVLEHLRAGETRAVMVGGAPGTGKTTVAQALADQFGWVVVSSDEVRKELAGLAHDESAEAAPDEGLYDPAEVDRAYRVLLDRAVQLMRRGESVVLDASWTTRRHRDWCRDAVEGAGARLSAIECVLDPAIAAHRVAIRRATAPGASDATAEVARVLASRREEWGDAFVVDTGRAADVVAERVIGLLEPRPSRPAGSS